MPARPQRVVERAHGEQGRLVHRARPLSSSSVGLSRGEMAPRCSVVAWRQGGPHLTFSFLLLLLYEFYEFPVEPGTGSRLGLIASACLRARLFCLRCCQKVTLLHFLCCIIGWLLLRC